jgi:hypothetical protein
LRRARPRADTAGRDLGGGEWPDVHARARARPARYSYTIIEVTTVRPDFRDTTYVHVARDSAGTLRVVGIWRL